MIGFVYLSCLWFGVGVWHCVLQAVGWSHDIDFDGVMGAVTSLYSRGQDLSDCALSWTCSHPRVSGLNFGLGTKIPQIIHHSNKRELFLKKENKTTTKEKRLKKDT